MSKDARFPTEAATATFGEQPGSVHLTFVSMIQAIALESTVSRFWALQSSSSLPRAMLWAQVIGLVLTIFWIWFGYSTLVISFRWRLSLMDLLFPFGAGIVEFVEAGLMGTPAIGLWVTFAGGGYLIGGWIFRGTLQRILVAADGRPATQALRTAPLRRVFALLGAVAAMGITIGVLAFGDVIPEGAVWVLIGIGDLVLLSVVVAWAAVARRIAAAETQGA